MIYTQVSVGTKLLLRWQFSTSSAEDNSILFVSNYLFTLFHFATGKMLKIVTIYENQTESQDKSLPWHFSLTINAIVANHFFTISSCLVKSWIATDFCIEIRNFFQTMALPSQESGLEIKKLSILFSFLWTFRSFRIKLISCYFFQ